MDVGIYGMACRTAGGVSSPADLLELHFSGRDAKEATKGTARACLFEEKVSRRMSHGSSMPASN